MAAHQSLAVAIDYIEDDLKQVVLGPLTDHFTKNSSDLHD